MQGFLATVRVRTHRERARLSISYCLPNLMLLCALARFGHRTAHLFQYRAWRCYHWRVQEMQGAKEVRAQRIYVHLSQPRSVTFIKDHQCHILVVVECENPGIGTTGPRLSHQHYFEAGGGKGWLWLDGGGSGGGGGGDLTGLRRRQRELQLRHVLSQRSRAPSSQHQMPVRFEVQVV